MPAPLGSFWALFLEGRGGKQAGRPTEKQNIVPFPCLPVCFAAPLPPWGAPDWLAVVFWDGALCARPSAAAVPPALVPVLLLGLLLATYQNLMAR